MKIMRIYIKAYYLKNMSRALKMHFMSISILSLYILCTVESLEIIWDNSIDQDLDGEINEEEVMHISNKCLIYPGTKWCGTGDIAADYDDLGEFRDVDKCCRAHDNCPDTIGAYQTKYNLTNNAFYTRLHCKCDMEFYDCLRAVNDFPSNQIGTIYFGILNTKCFEENYPITGCAHNMYFPIWKCLNYTYDITKMKEYQWFDLPNYYILNSDEKVG